MGPEDPRQGGAIQSHGGFPWELGGPQAESEVPQEESQSHQGLSWPREQSTPWTEHLLGSKPWARLAMWEQEAAQSRRQREKCAHRAPVSGCNVVLRFWLGSASRVSYVLCSCFLSPALPCGNSSDYVATILELHALIVYGTCRTACAWTSYTTSLLRGDASAGPMIWCTTLDTIILEQLCTLTSQSFDILKAKATFKTLDFIDALVLSKILVRVKHSMGTRAVRTILTN
ncbi:uncharacterized protein LOC134759791 isoform X2 [Pongo abelii]|uniref:uncharacterized protein LOC134759791 isoform X2 n=1 Tax=Pongo abelii TaxID=9601 RepID=UPI003004D487